MVFPELGPFCRYMALHVMARFVTTNPALELQKRCREVVEERKRQPVGSLPSQFGCYK